MPRQSEGSRKAKAFILFDQGKRPSDPEVKALGLKSSSLYNYYELWKAWKRAGSGGGVSVPPASVSTVGRTVEVGKITITPENWGMDQYGAILVLDTYNKAKRDINYGGTIGDFLCDICEFYRRILNYKEVEYGREQAGEGRGGAEENGKQGAGSVGRLIEGQ